MKRFKFINIRQVSEETHEGKPVYRVFNNKSGGELALICWYRPWRQFVFKAKDSSVFNNTCLQDILEFMNKP